MEHTVAIDQALGRAFDQVGRVLFNPFHATRWLKLTLVAWLVGLGAPGLNCNCNYPGGGGGKRSLGGGGGPHLPDPTAKVWGWIRENPQEAMLIGAVLVAVGVVVFVLLKYLSARFEFVLLANVANKSTSIGEPFARYERPATSWFWFQLVLALLLGAALVALAAYPAYSGYQAWRDEAHPTPAQVVLWIGSGMLAFLLLLLSSLVGVVARDLVVPVMFLKELPLREAWRRVRPILGENLGRVGFFVLARLGLSIGAVIAETMLGCFAGFCVFVPTLLAVVFLLAVGSSGGPPEAHLTLGRLLPAIFLGCGALLVFVFLAQVFTLPMPVFFRTFSLAFVEGYGPEYRSITPPEASLAPSDAQPQPFPPFGLPPPPPPPPPPPVG
ncbi:MAG: hypothetical protein HYZ53_20095 [Planctomycetes bacterium]|nr:hypothetical protein [Planctomycetota bacterium]